jgi:hypothetical protein
MRPRTLRNYEKEQARKKDDKSQNFVNAGKMATSACRIVYGQGPEF